MIGRSELINEVTRLVRLRESVFIKAMPGSGSTTLLKSLNIGVYSRPKTVKHLVSNLVNDSGVLSDLEKKLNPEVTVLLLDDAHALTKSVKSYIEDLIRSGLTIVAVGRFNVFNLPNELVLNDLSYSDAVRLVNEKLGNVELSRVIVSEVGTNPSRLINAVRKAKARTDLFTVEGFNDFKRRINFSIPRRDLLSPAVIGVLVSALFSLKYVFYTFNFRHEGYIAALVAFALSALSRFFKSKRA